MINESIVGSSLIRVLNAGSYEEKKFDVVNNKAKDIGTKITVGFATLLPVINLVVNAAFLIVLGYGGYQIIEGTLSVGEFSAFFFFYFFFFCSIIF